MCYATKHIKQLQQAVSDFESTFSKLGNKVSEYDTKLSKLYHDLELRKFNAAEGYYIAKELQMVLRQRRVVKNELSRMDSLRHTLNLNGIKSSLAKSNNNVGKLIKKNEEYTANFEDEVFDAIH